jgi:hypothetical protein
MGDFFDDFGKGEGMFTSEEEHARIRAALLADNATTPGDDGGGGAAAAATTTAAAVPSAASPSSLQARFCALLTEMVAGRYPSLEAAQAAHPLDPYLRAAADAGALESMRAEAAAAARCAAELQQQGGEKDGKGTWEPPPEDEEPETAQDYE